jgi:hypothetical protein
LLLDSNNSGIILVNELEYCLSLLLTFCIDLIDEAEPVKPELPTTTAPTAVPIVPLFDSFGLTKSSISSSSDSKSFWLYSIEFLIDFI